MEAMFTWREKESAPGRSGLTAPGGRIFRSPPGEALAQALGKVSYAG